VRATDLQDSGKPVSPDCAPAISGINHPSARPGGEGRAEEPDVVAVHGADPAEADLPDLEIDGGRAKVVHSRQLSGASKRSDAEPVSSARGRLADEEWVY
jgi:hypothetical protein